jgi:hypothetical protein
MTAEALGALGQTMEGEAAKLMEEVAPREMIKAKAEEPAIHA